MTDCGATGSSCASAVYAPGRRSGPPIDRRGRSATCSCNTWVRRYDWRAPLTGNELYYDARQREAETPYAYFLRPRGGVTRRTAAATADPARSRLSPLCRPAHAVRRAELLERRRCPMRSWVDCWSRPWRRDGIPTLTVQADVAQGASPEGVVAALAPAVATLQATLPRSYHIAVGGTVEESAQSQASVFAVV